MKELYSDSERMFALFFDEASQEYFLEVQVPVGENQMEGVQIRLYAEEASVYLKQLELGNPAPLERLAESLVR